MDVASHSSGGSVGGSSSKGVGKFLPKSLAAKARWKKQPSKESFGSTASSEEDPRGRELTRDVGPDDSPSSRPASASQPNYGLDIAEETVVEGTGAAVSEGDSDHGS